MADEKYRIILHGYIPGKGEHYVEEAFAKLFKISHEQAKEYFKATPKTITEDLSKEQTDHYMQEMKKIGVKCEAEDMRVNYDLSGLSLEPK
ncbi:MAG: hypothetical protein ACR2RB_19215 [Gammaproteobacteria bacterium]